MNWFKRLFGRGESAPPPEMRAEPPKVSKPKSWFERMKDRFPSLRFIDTSYGGLNMPKRQPCPMCGKNCKRVMKTLGGAKYHCPKPDHGDFLVTHPGGIMT
jgi:hypothetical protein